MSPGRGVAASTAEPTRAHTAANQPNGRLSKTDTDAHDPFAPPTSPRPRRAPGVRPHPHDLLQEQPVPTGMFDERAGDNAAPKLSGGLSLGPLSSRRIQVSVCGYARKTHLRFTYKGSARMLPALLTIVNPAYSSSYSYMASMSNPCPPPSAGFRDGGFAPSPFLALAFAPPPNPPSCPRGG
jgi:hypothetical protein